MANADYTVVVMSPDLCSAEPRRSLTSIHAPDGTACRRRPRTGVAYRYATGNAAEYFARRLRFGMLDALGMRRSPCVSEARRQTAIFSHSWLTSLYLSRPCIRTCCAGSKRQERHFRRHAPRHLRQCLQTGIMNFCDSSPCQTIFLRSNTAKRCSSSLLLFYRSDSSAGQWVSR